MKSGSRLERILAAGHFAVTSELGPPKNADPDNIRKKASYCLGNVDAANVTDNQTAIVRMSSIAAGTIALSCGVEPVIQMVCRDRNRIAMQSDILGAAALGCKNLLCLSGDHQKFGNHPQASGVYDLDSMQLIDMVRRMRDDKTFLSGEPIKDHEPRFFIGAAANPFADPLNFRITRLAKKIAAGVDFIQTQCIFDIDRFEQYMKMVVDRGLHEKAYILAGLAPVRSERALQYMKDEVPGMSVPDELIARMAAVKDKDEKMEEGIKICLEMIECVKHIEGVRGIHLMPVGWESITPVIVERAGLLPRPDVA